MNIKQALKYKNKLASKMNEEFEKANRYNSVEEGNVRPYSAFEALNKAIAMSNELVELKTKIHKANSEVYDKIFMMSELKTRIIKLKNLDCSEGKRTDRYGLRSETPIINTVEINIITKDVLIHDIELQIEKLQDELDAHNATTII